MPVFANPTCGDALSRRIARVERETALASVRGPTPSSRRAAASTTCARTFAVALAVVLSAAADVAQAPVPSARATSAERPGLAPAAAGSEEAKARAVYGKLPLAFVPNAGQTDARVRFSAQTSGASFHFTRRAAVLSLGAGGTGRKRGAVLRLAFLGANPEVEIEGRGRGRATVNYLLGSDPSQWRTGLPTYGAVVYRELWPGIDMVFRGAGGRLKYEFVLRPGGRVADIRLAYRGARRLSITRAGALAIATPVGVLRDERPRSHQTIGARLVAVASRFALARDGAYGFALGRYDRGRTLVIDPGLRYSTYLGGGGEDAGSGIAVDGHGRAYVTGETWSTNFPTRAGAFDATRNGDSDAFVSKLDATGSTLVYSTYLGGGGYDVGGGIGVDGAGRAYVTGRTFSRRFPTTAGAFDRTLSGDGDAYVAKLDATGSTLVYSTFLGGGGGEFSGGIALDGAGLAYVTGFTDSRDFPTTAGAFDSTLTGFGDSFVAKLDASGSALVYSTYLGGGGYDFGGGIAIDAAGSAYVAGSTESSDFPTTAGAFDTTSNGGGDAFVTKLDPTGSALVYSTYLGGRESESGRGIAVDAAGSAYVASSTDSSDFPITAGAFDTTSNGDADAFVTKLDPTGSALLYSTYLGGGGEDLSGGIAIDGAGRAHVTGGTRSTTFPTTAGAFDRTLSGERDAFVTKLDATGSALLYSTYLGGGGDEFGGGIAVDGAGRAYVTGRTGSRRFPTTPGAFDAAFNGVSDAFVTKLDPTRAECRRLTLARRTGRVGVRMVACVRVLDRRGRPLGGVRVTARGAGVRAAARTGPAGYARLALRPRRVGVITIRAGSRAACVRRIRVAGAGKPPPLTGRSSTPRGRS